MANFTGMEITETGRQVMDLAKNRLIPIREEKAKKETQTTSLENFTMQDIVQALQMLKTIKG